MKTFLQYLKESEDMFAQSNRVDADIAEYNHPLRELGCDKGEYEALVNEIQWCANKTTDDERLEAACDELENQIDPQLYNFIENILAGGMKPEGYRFDSGLVNALEDGQRRFGTEPRAAVHGATMALSRAAKAAWELDELDN
jgi:hypothetical protein